MRSGPEYRIAHLVHLPRSHEGNIAGNSGFKDISPSIELPKFLLVPRNFDAFGHAPIVIANRYRTFLHCGGSASGREKRGYTSGVRSETFGKSALRHELQRNLPLKIELLKELVPKEKRGHETDRRGKTDATNAPIYEDIILSICPA
jgi:hypothetical protein